jgi:hypothetical protein
MGTNISIVCPTRNRVKYAQKFIQFASQVEDDEISFIVSDNSTNNDYSNQIKQMCIDHNVKLIRPPHSLSMIDHWNFALSNVGADADYVGIMTDKMFVVPQMILRVKGFLKHLDTDLLTWSANTFFPSNGDQPFSSGYYQKNIFSNNDVNYYDPQEELARRLSGSENRRNYDQLAYGRGKVCFGLYSQKTVHEIKRRFGRVFHPLTPDYSSLSLALGVSNVGVELNIPAIIQINSVLSTGNDMDLDDDAALRFLESSFGSSQFLHTLPIPFLYSSINNVVLHEYLTYHRLSGSQLEIDWSNWIHHISDDLMGRERRWSSSESKLSQFNQLRTFVANCELLDKEKLIHQIELESGQENCLNDQIKGAPKLLSSNVLEYPKRAYRKIRFGDTNSRVKSFDDLSLEAVNHWKRRSRWRE